MVSCKAENTASLFNSCLGISRQLVDLSFLLISICMLLFAVMESFGLAVWFNFTLLYPFAKKEEEVLWVQRIRNRQKTWKT